MSLPKIGTRKVVVDGEAFRWLIRRKPTYTQWATEFGCLHVAVEDAKQPCSILVIRTDKPHPQGLGSFQRVTVFPFEVAVWIRQALHLGWQPLQDGATFTVEVSGANLQRVKR